MLMGDVILERCLMEDIGVVSNILLFFLKNMIDERLK